jgi:hypothetical protein
MPHLQSLACSCSQSAAALRAAAACISRKGHAACQHSREQPAGNGRPLRCKCCQRPPDGAGCDCTDVRQLPSAVSSAGHIDSSRQCSCAASARYITLRVGSCTQELACSSGLPAVAGYCVHICVCICQQAQQRPHRHETLTVKQTHSSSSSNWLT